MEEGSQEYRPPHHGKIKSTHPIFRLVDVIQPVVQHIDSYSLPCVAAAHPLFHAACLADEPWMHRYRRQYGASTERIRGEWTLRGATTWLARFQGEVTTTLLLVVTAVSAGTKNHDKPTACAGTVLARPREDPLAGAPLAA